MRMTMQQRENITQAIAWHPSLEQSKDERITEVSFGPFREFTKRFVSRSNANIFRDYLRSLNISHDIMEYDFDDYGRIR